MVIILKNAIICAILPITDITKSKDFYENKLGLVLSSEPVPSDSLLYQGSGSSSLYLYKREPVTVVHTQVGFMVENIEDEVSALKARGVVFEEYDMPNLKTVDNIATIGRIKSAWFKDPDGNILAINQM